ncbi:MAG: hypothetical protein EBS19_09985 [Spirochaetia bacterium]|nr:hypothetical protein [Spirochaetia bacterium]
MIYIIRGQDERSCLAEIFRGMEGIDKIDFSKSKWSPENEIYLMSIIEGIKENYPQIDLEEELRESGYSFENLLDSKIIVSFMKKLNEKYPD